MDSIKTRNKKKGQEPGTLMYTGEKTENIKISLIDYNEKELDEKIIEKVEECFPFKDNSNVTWINIRGLHNIKIIDAIGKHFDLHPLLLEDILATDQRPKTEDFEDYFFTVLRMFEFDEKKKTIEHEQVSIVFGKNFVISFQEKNWRIFEPIRERLRNKKGKIRKLGSDFLAYNLIDIIVDNYFSVLEQIGERIEKLENELLKHPEDKTLGKILKIKREIIY